MKFTNYLEKITGVSVYPIISLVLFFTFFVLVTLWIYRINKADLKHLENLPLQ